MPGWFGPRYELQRSNISRSFGDLGGSLCHSMQSGSAVSDARRMWAVSSSMLMLSVCQKK